MESRGRKLREGVREEKEEKTRKRGEGGRKRQEGKKR